MGPAAAGSGEPFPTEWLAFELPEGLCSWRFAAACAVAFAVGLARPLAGLAKGHLRGGRWRGALGAAWLCGWWAWHARKARSCFV